MLISFVNQNLSLSQSEEILSQSHSYYLPLACCDDATQPLVSLSGRVTALTKNLLNPVGFLATAAVLSLVTLKIFRNEVLKYFIESGAAFSAKFMIQCFGADLKKLENPTDLLIKYGHLDLLLEYIEQEGIDPFEEDCDGHSIIRYAAQNDHLEILRHFLSHNGACQCEGYSQAQWARFSEAERLNKLYCFYVSIPKGLVEIMEDGICNRDAVSAVFLAAANGHLAYLKAFSSLEDLPSFIFEGSSRVKLVHAAAYSGSLEVLRYLKSEGCLFADLDAFRGSIFLYAACAGHGNVFKFLLEEEPSLAEIMRSEESLFILAFLSGNMDLFRYLENEVGVSSNLRDHLSRGPLELASSGFTASLIYLEEHYPAHFAANKVEYFKSAVLGGQLETAKYLLSTGIDAACIEGSECFVSAIYSGNCELVQWICSIYPGILSDVISGGHDAEILAMVTQYGSIKLLKWLVEEKGLNLNADPRRVIEAAFEEPRMDIMHYLDQHLEQRFWHAYEGQLNNLVSRLAVKSSVALVRWLILKIEPTYLFIEEAIRVGNTPVVYELLRSSLLAEDDSDRLRAYLRVAVQSNQCAIVRDILNRLSARGEQVIASEEAMGNELILRIYHDLR